MGDLGPYRDKRDFEKTPEPSGRVHRQRGTGGRLVVQKHAARRLHYDLRLEMDGVYRSWAVPKGFDMAPGERRLAVHVEDHPLEYGDFEGVIPRGEYGAGTVMVWDRGTWGPVAGDAASGYAEGKLDIVLHGTRLAGRWTLVRTQMGRESEDNWLLIRRRQGADMASAAGTADRSVDSGRTMDEIARGASASPRHPEEGEVPPFVAPALATRVSRPPAGEEWLHEIKLDGYRLLVRIEGGRVALLTRNGRDWSGRFPEIAAAFRELGLAEALVDGEVVDLRPGGQTSFEGLQEALSSGRTGGLVYQAFDLLHVNGADLTREPLEERKRRLKALLAGAPGRIRYLDHLQTDGPRTFDEACSLGLEGIVSKRRDAPYRSGRGRSWLKSKCEEQDEFVVGGYTEPGGSRTDLGALLLGQFGSGGLRYTGRVGTGFDARMRRVLRARLAELETRQSPFSAPVDDAAGARWVKPELVVDVTFTEKTRDGRLRHPVFRGVREDKGPEEIRADAETPAAPSQVARRRPAKSPGGVRIAGVRLTNPDRVLYPRQGLTKRAVAEYVAEVGERMLAGIARRPLALVRCPAGRQRSCFFQKHPGEGFPAAVRRFRIPGKEADETGLYVDSVPGLVSLVQMGVLELHAWGSTIDHLEQPDTVVFDLDPDENLPWDRVVDAALDLRERIEALHLPAFARLTGGKGIHLVVPIVPSRSWREVKAFARGVAAVHARDAPKRYTIKAAKSARKGRIFIDYLRNGRGATAICSYSTRARPGAPVAVPVRVDELRRAGSAARYDVVSVRRRLASLNADPWADFDEARVPLEETVLHAVGVHR